MTLLGPGATLLAALGDRARDGDEAGTWNCVALAEDRIVQVIAKSDDTDWDLGSRDQEHTHLTAQSWPRAEIARVEVVDVERVPVYVGTDWEWNVRLKVVMRDGAQIELPPGGGFASGHATQEQDAFTRLLCGWA